MSAQPLDPLQLPLHGVRLIEASAGTGKTWTIAALYLRLVLGHGSGTPLLPAQILVLTFTKAATAELRDRIRARLTEGAAVFRGQPAPDDFLAALLAEYPHPDARAAAARQLELAAQWMDEAAVHTIHGWAQRMLAQHAFDSGHPFVQDIQTDDGELHMALAFVKAAGGCSAPPGKDAEAARATLGRMRLRAQPGATPGEPALAQLMISHPNDSGLVMDQTTRLYTPPHFVRSVEVSYAGRPVLTADLDFAISENPHLRFRFRPGDGDGELRARVVDSDDLHFEQSIAWRAAP